MQMLCGDPESHRTKRRPDLWADDSQDLIQNKVPGDGLLCHADPVTGGKYNTQASIIHLPHRKTFARESFDTCKRLAGIKMVASNTDHGQSNVINETNQRVIA